jgi:hypothetical protein
VPERIASKLANTITNFAQKTIDNVRSIFTPSLPPAINNLPFGYINSQDSAQQQRQ